jgi:hypothetical protein
MLQVDIDDVDSDDESFHTKARQVLRRLQSGQYDAFWAGPEPRCPFCSRSIARDPLTLLRHAKDVSSTCPKVGQTVNVHAFAAKHKALGLHLRHRRNLAIERGEIPPPKPKRPKVPGIGSKKYRKRQREEEAAMRRG